MKKLAAAVLAGVALCLYCLATLGAAPTQSPHGNGIDCKQCHSCSSPTKANPCLKICPRSKAPVVGQKNQGPDIVILDELEDLYVPVRFNHKKHAGMSGMAKGCDACHHYTPANTEHPTCKSCHPVDIIHEDISQPGLKGAYHRQCLSCHSEWDHDTKCEICHEKKAGGRLQGTATDVCEHSHYEAVPLDELIVFPTKYAPGDKVPFHHRSHSQKYERDCTECHKQQSCTRCHVQGGELHPMGDLAKVNLHDTCFTCHNGERCQNCHGRSSDKLFQHSDTGWPLQSYHASLHCKDCHGASGAIHKLDTQCSSCHPAGWDAKTFNHRITGVVLDDVHREVDCEACHSTGPGSKPACDGCHDDGRSYSKAKGFGKS